MGWFIDIQSVHGHLKLFWFLECTDVLIHRYIRQDWDIEEKWTNQQYLAIELGSYGNKYDRSTVPLVMIRAAPCRSLLRCAGPGMVAVKNPDAKVYVLHIYIYTYRYKHSIYTFAWQGELTIIVIHLYANSGFTLADHFARSIHGEIGSYTVKYPTID